MRRELRQKYEGKMFPLQPDQPTPLAGKVGYAWFFENIVIYGDTSALIHFLLSRKSKNYGEFLGVVKGFIPVDPFYVLYQWINWKPTPTIDRYLERKKMRSLVKKLRKKKFYRYQFELERMLKEHPKLHEFLT